ncbi:MAG: hypothetical protein IPL08_12700 [Saprospiraceae bacterium]|nr:hypothetical protein [Saprospiraceae bacterium]
MLGKIRSHYRRISSQYNSTPLIAPTLQQGLQIHLEKGDIVSRPYIEMTLGIMKYFGVTSVWENQTIVVPHQPYQARDFHVEADWSAASYFYTIAGLAIAQTSTAWITSG